MGGLKKIMIHKRRDMTSSSSSVVSTYSIPKGFLFDYCSCPHYLLDICIYIVIWIFLCIHITFNIYFNNSNNATSINNTDYNLSLYDLMLSCNNSVDSDNGVVMVIMIIMLPMTLCVLWVISNLSIVAKQNYDWYCDQHHHHHHQQQHDDNNNNIPRHWKIMIPFIW